MDNTAKTKQIASISNGINDMRPPMAMIVNANPYMSCVLSDMSLTSHCFRVRPLDCGVHR